MDRKQQVTALLKSLGTAATEPLNVIDATYQQHNHSVEDGIEGFKKMVQAVPQGSSTVDTVRVLQDGGYVAAHSEYNLFGPKVGFDIFRFSGDKIVERWDNLQEKSITPNPSGHTMLDGASEVTDLDRQTKTSGWCETSSRKS